MKYAYEELSPNQFEGLVVAICQFVLGTSVQGFATGPDGGRDAKFVGTADLLPSGADPWKGTVIVQAKHTNGYNMAFSDLSFYSEDNAATVLAEEIPRIKKLRAALELDHYLLFSNRKLTANGEANLRSVICRECGLPYGSVMLCGIEQIELWLKRFPQCAQIADVDPIDSPLQVSPDDLAEVVEHLAKHLSENTPPPTNRVSLERKNVLNNMSAEFARELRRRYLPYTYQIQHFLAAPENEQILRLYQSAAEEFQLQVVAKRKDYQTFDEVINYLSALIISRDPILRRNKKLTRVMVFYMYWNCDLGINDDISTP